MPIDFSQPQRQSAIGIVVVFFYALQKNVRSLWPMLIIIVLRINQNNYGYYLLGILVAMAILAIISYLRFINFTFYIDDATNEFTIQEGILNKTKTTIGLDKIQQININQSFIQKLVGVYEVAFDTAGSSKSEGTIKAISHQLAIALKAKLLINQNIILTKRDEKEAGFVEKIDVNSAQPIIRIGILSLVKIGITSNYAKSFSLLMVLAVTVFDNIRQFTKNGLMNEINIESAVSQNFSGAAISIFVIIAFMTIIIVNLVATILKYFDLSVQKQDGSLLLSHGLLNSKSAIIKPEKVQIVYTNQNFIQKKLNVSQIEIKQAAAAQIQKGSVSKIAIPGCSVDEKNKIFELLYDNIPKKGQLLLPNIRKLIVAMFLYVLLPLVLYFSLTYFIAPQLASYKSYVIAFMVFMPILQYIKFRNYQLYINDSYIIKQSGLWDITTEILMPQKIQAIKSSQLFWHKRLDIGSIIIYTAGGKLTFDLGNYSILEQKINWWLYNIEKTSTQIL